MHEKNTIFFSCNFISVPTTWHESLRMRKKFLISVDFFNNIVESQTNELKTNERNVPLNPISLVNFEQRFVKYVLTDFILNIPYLLSLNNGDVAYKSLDFLY